MFPILIFLGVSFHKKNTALKICLENINLDLNKSFLLSHIEINGK